MADRLKAREWVIICCLQTRIDDERIGYHQNSASIRRCASRSFGRNHATSAWSVFDQDGLSSYPTDLIRKEPRQCVHSSPRGERNDHPHRFSRLCRRNVRYPHEQDTNGRSSSGQAKESIAKRRHAFPSANGAVQTLQAHSSDYTCGLGCRENGMKKLGKNAEIEGGVVCASWLRQSDAGSWRKDLLL